MANYNGRPRKFSEGQVINGFEILEYLGCFKCGSKYKVRHVDCGHVSVLWTQNIGRTSHCSKCPSVRSSGVWKHWVSAKRRGATFKSAREMEREVMPCPGDDYTLVANNEFIGFGPGNWKWVRKEEARVPRVPPVEVCGVSMSQARWARLCGVSRERMRQRLNTFSPAGAILYYESAVAYVAQRTGMGLEELRTYARTGVILHIANSNLA